MLIKQNLPIRLRFINAQAEAIGKKYGKSGIYKNVSYRPQNISNSQFNNNWISSNNRSQQQDVLPMQQESKLNVPREREKNIHELEV